MFKRRKKTKPAHVRLQTHKHKHSVARSHTPDDREEAVGKKNKKKTTTKNKGLKQTHSFLSNDTDLKKIQTKQGRVVKIGTLDGWIVSEQTEKQRSGQMCVCVQTHTLTSVLRVQDAGRNLHFLDISLWRVWWRHFYSKHPC